VKTVESKIAAVMDRAERLKRLSDKINTFNAYAQSADLKDLTERNLQIATAFSSDTLTTLMFF
jgi:hypothetical protein